MYIRRKVFSLLQDETGEERYFSTTDVTLENEEERTFSVAEDAESLEEKDFSDKKKEEDDEPKLTTSDKINIKLNKALTTKKDREAFVEAFEDGKSHKYGKHSGSLDTKTKLAVDRVKVADGKMTKEEFAKKWRSKK